jgi:undecaprenyl-diphosphatase
MVQTIVIFCAQYLPFLIIAVALWFLLRLEISKRKSALGLLVLASTVAFVIDKILNQIISSPRPFVMKDITPLFAHAADNGFPSEHVLFAMVIASIVFAYNRKLGVILSILALGIGLARVIANVHHPIDVLGGAVIAITSVWGSYYVISRQRIQSLLGIKNG